MPIAPITPPPVLYGPDYLAIPRPETPWLIRSLVPRSGLVLVHAPAKQGKSTIILQLAEALSTPETPTFFGLGIHEHGPVGFLQLDTPPDLWAMEYVQAQTNSGLDFAHTAFLDRSHIPQALWPFNARVSSSLDWLASWCHQFKPIAVIVDSYRASFRGEEKDSDITNQVITGLQKAIGSAALIILHHNRKPAADAIHTDESQIDESRGSTTLPAMVDIVWRISRKRWKIQGRGGDVTLDTVFDRETGLYHPKSPITPELILALKSDDKYKSDRARATQLQALTGLPFETCRNHFKKR